MKIFKNNFLENLNNYRLTVPIILLVSLIMLFLSEFVCGVEYIFLLILLVMFLFICIFLNFGNVICILMFLISFWGIGGKPILDINWTYWLYFIAIIVFGLKVFIETIRKKKYFYINIIIVSLFIIVLCFFNFNVNNIFQLFVYFSLIAWLYLVFIYRNDINFIKLVKYLIYGLLISVLISFMFTLFEKTKTIVLSNTELRFQGLTKNANLLAILSALVISFIFYLYFSNRLKLYLATLMFLFFSLIGIFTQSKNFLLTFFILIIMLFILLIHKHKKLGVCYSLCIVAISLVFLLIFKNKVIEIFNRFIKYEYTSLLDKITTGRWSIWMEYLRNWTGSILSIIFGCGVTADGVVENIEHPHSFYVKLLVDMGIIGVILMVVLIYYYIRHLKEKDQKLEFIRFIPLISCLILAISECLLGPLNLLLVISFIFIFDIKEKNIVN